MRIKAAGKPGIRGLLCLLGCLCLLAPGPVLAGEDPQEQVERLEERVRELEAENEQLTADLKKAKKSAKKWKKRYQDLAAGQEGAAETEEEPGQEDEAGQEENLQEEETVILLDGEVAATPAPEPEKAPALGKDNALAQAKKNLSLMPFSYSGLIKQLGYSGYSHDEAVYAADACEANWKEQAEKQARAFLELTNFSADALIRQLMIVGFTQEEAEYGAMAAGETNKDAGRSKDSASADPGDDGSRSGPDSSSYFDEEEPPVLSNKESALQAAKAYLSYGEFSYLGLARQLMNAGFTQEEAVYGVDNCGADWKDQAARAAGRYLQAGPLSHEQLADQLKKAGFTEEEAEYGAVANGL